MTGTEMVVAAQQRLTELATRALMVHRTKGTRRFITHMHNRWQYEMAVSHPGHAPLDESTESAFTELQAATSELLARRGFDPDVYLHWLDLYPSLVVNVYLRAEQPHTV